MIVIVLDKKEYCDNCPNMEPVAVHNNIYADGKIVITETVIRCASAQRCEVISKYLEGRRRP